MEHSSVMCVSSSSGVRKYIKPVRRHVQKAGEKWKGGVEMHFILKAKMVIVHWLQDYICRGARSEDRRPSRNGSRSAGRHLCSGCVGDKPEMQHLWYQSSLCFRSVVLRSILHVMLWSLGLIMRKTESQRRILRKKVYSNISNQNIENGLYWCNLEAERLV